jgi:hypothetical protein
LQLLALLCYDARTVAGWAHYHGRGVKSFQNLSVVAVLELLSAAAVLPLLLAKQEQAPPANLALICKALAQLLMMRLDAHYQRYQRHIPIVHLHNRAGVAVAAAASNEIGNKHSSV